MLKEVILVIIKIMIIPIRCFTCNMLLASKYRSYLEIIKQRQEQEGEQIVGEEQSKQSSVQEAAFQKLEIHRYCCRRHLLTHIDLVDKI